MSGDVLRLKSAKHYGGNGKNWIEFKAHRDTVMVAVVVGSESLKDPGHFDFIGAMAKLGYQPMTNDASLARLRAIEAAAKAFIDGQGSAEALRAALDAVAS
jgi:hypothetical protein